MNRNRLNQLRHMDRGQDGLHQVIQMQAGGAGGGGAQTHERGQSLGQNPAGAQGQQQQQQNHPLAQSLRRKTTYTRTELLCRGLPTTQNVRRTRATAGQDWATSPSAQVTHPPMGQNSSTPRKPQRSYLPRVAKPPAPKVVERSPNRIAHRLRPETEAKPEQQHQPQHQPQYQQQQSQMQSPMQGHKISHLTNTPQGSDCSSLGVGGSSSSDRHKIKLAKAIRLPDHQNKSFVYLCKPVKKVKELLTARKLRTSCEHLDQVGDLGQEGDQLNRTFSGEPLLRSRSGGEGEGADDFTLAPLMQMSPSSSSSSQMDSPPLVAMKQRQVQLEDQAAGQERLLSQLREVRQRQWQLRQLELEEPEEPDEEERERQLDMDLVCQNLPALHHEIRLLQQLSEKLEATLKVTSTGKPVGENTGCGETEAEKQSSSIFYTPRTGPINYDELPITQLGCLRLEQIPMIRHRAGIISRAHNFGLVHEFRIETKTLNELRTGDESQCFYLPAPSLREDHPLQRTNFRKLRENPNVLLQQLRPLSTGTGRPFNLLDQDQMFFNSLAYAESKLTGNGNGNGASDGLLGSSHSPEREAGGGGGGLSSYGAYSLLAVEALGLSGGSQSERPPGGDELPRHRSSSLVMNNHTQTEIESPKNQKSNPGTPNSILTSCARRKKSNPSKLRRDAEEAQRLLETNRKVRFPTAARQVARESPIERRMEPKVRMQLLKTVLVGMVQVAIFLVLIMAFTYPDVSC
ncbi:hypothetical protein KR009_011678 [Drosophila setifemur]|nr:hypothetical protein KR009_011678 [Drosophila setifemur]